MGIGIILSQLKIFEKPKLLLEQYPTDSEVAEKLLNYALLIKSTFENLTFADIGAGTGVLGIGALLLGAKKVCFIEKDNDAIEILKENLQRFNFDLNRYVILNEDVNDLVKNQDLNLIIGEKIDVSLINPPFGTKNRHADLVFYDFAFLNSESIFSITKTTTVDYLLDYSRKSGFNGRCLENMKHLIKRQFSFHKSNTRFIDTSLLYFNKINS